MKKIKFFKIILAAVLTVSARGIKDSKSVWVGFNDAWVIEEADQLNYLDIKREHPALMTLFCRSKLDRNGQIAFKARITDIIDSMYFGISCRSGDYYYDFLLSGTKEISTINTVHRTLVIGEVLSSNSQSLQKPVPIDTQWHDIRYSFSDNHVAIYFDSSEIKKIKLPFKPQEKINWGFGALYCNVGIKDLMISDSGAETVPVTIHPDSILTIPVFKGMSIRSGSDRITGY